MAGGMLAMALWMGLVAGPGVAPDPVGGTGGSRSWLGVWVTDAVDGGVEIVGLSPHGPALRAGLRVGDVMVEAGGRELPDQSELNRVLLRVAPGHPLPVTLLRGGETVELRIELGERAPTSPTPPGPPRVRAEAPQLADRLESVLAARRSGLEVEEVSPALRVHYGAPEDAGVLVVRVDPERPAARAGLRVGDVLVRVGGREIRRRGQIEQALRAWNGREPLEAGFVRDGRLHVVALTPQAEPDPQGRAREAHGEALELRRRKLRLEIERLERRIAELERELERLGGAR